MRVAIGRRNHDAVVGVVLVEHFFEMPQLFLKAISDERLAGAQIRIRLPFDAFQISLSRFVGKISKAILGGLEGDIGEAVVLIQVVGYRIGCEFHRFGYHKLSQGREPSRWHLEETPEHAGLKRPPRLARKPVMLDINTFPGSLRLGERARDVNQQQHMAKLVAVAVEIVQFLLHPRQGFAPCLKEKLSRIGRQVGFPLIGVEAVTARAPEHERIVVIAGVITKKQFRRQVVAVQLVEVLETERPEGLEGIGGKEQEQQRQEWNAY